MYGKVLGALVGAGLGLAFSSPTLAIVLAALGVLVGHALDDKHVEAPEPASGPAAPQAPAPSDEPRSRAELEREARMRFARHVCTLFAEVARVDGEVVRDEVRVARDFFERELGFDAAELEQVRLSLKEALAKHRDLGAVAKVAAAGLLPAERLLLLNALYELGLSDGPLTGTEREAIDRVARGLDIGVEDHRSIAALHLGRGDEHYAVLGLSADAGDDQVKRAFRRLAMLHHPDKFAHLGPGAVELASRKFAEISAAYDAVCRLRGL